MRYLVCEVEYFYDHVFDGDLCRVTRPLQSFNSEQEAIEVAEMFGPFYEHIRVVPADELQSEFR